jgi:hypothetical protein
MSNNPAGGYGMGMEAFGLLNLGFVNMVMTQMESDV